MPATAQTTTVQEDNLKELVVQGLRALKAGGDRAAEAADDVQDSATNPDLKQALEEGQKTAKEWQSRVEQAMQQAGASGASENPVIDAVYEVSKKARQAADDDATRDLGIIASGQLALHYWVAAFGTMANYLGRLGMDDAADAMSRSVDEAKQADEEHTRIAEQILGQDS